MKARLNVFITITSVFICLSLVESTSPTEVPKNEKPNIVLCMADDQGWGDMGYYGHPVIKTPNFDKVASTALRFDRFYSASSVCSPTRASVLTGRDPNRTGCNWIGQDLRPQEITFAEALKKAGYVTGHFGKWHVGSVRKGDPTNPGACGFDEWLSDINHPEFDPILNNGDSIFQFQGPSSIILAEAAIKYMRKHAHSDKPFLAVIWFGAPHVGHKASEQDREPYNDLPENPTLLGYSHGSLESHTSDRFSDIQTQLQHFYGEITEMDRAFGMIREELRNLDIHENTILWHTGDNGAIRDLGVSGGRGCKGDLYEGGIRVPAILEWPARIQKQEVTKIPCYTNDIYPTLLDIAGVEIENQPIVDGISLLPLIEGKMDSRPNPMGFWKYTPATETIGTPSMNLLLEAQREGREPVDEWALHTDAGLIVKQYPNDIFTGNAVWLEWPWKLHRIQNESGIISYKLFNLSDDSLEENDLTKYYPHKVGAMNSEIEKWQKSVISSLNGNDYTPGTNDNDDSTGTSGNNYQLNLNGNEYSFEKQFWVSWQSSYLQLSNSGAKLCYRKDLEIPAGVRQ
ncbi:sulfatase, partial [Bacteroidota bacterium]